MRLLEVIAQAARAYREAMRHYIRQQTAQLDQGMPIEGVADAIPGGFTALAETEDALDDALVVLEWFESSERSE